MKKHYLLRIIVFLLCLISTRSFSQTIADGIYLLHSKPSGKVVEVSNVSSANNGNVDIWDFANQDFQRWFVRGLGNGIYTCTNEGSGKMLHIANATPANSVNVDQFDNTNDNTVKWKIVSDGAGSYIIQSAANTNFVLDVNASGTANGTNIQLYSSNNSEAQKFTFELIQTKIVYLVADAHLDTQWDWTVQQTIGADIKKTLVDNFALIEKYPDYVFNFEGAINYIWAKEYYPDLYAKLKTYVAQGRWHIAGGSLNANDVLVSSPESFFRNVYLGQTFFKNEFNQKSNEIFMPDCFGFGYNLPTIAKHCGLNGFTTQKLSWGSAYGTPFNIGVWQGVDGSQILTALNPGAYNTTFNSDISTNTNFLNETNAVGDKSGNYVHYKYYGTGDQGGAPTEESVQWMEKSLSGKGTGPLTIVSATSGELFNKFSPDQYSKFSLYNNELPMRQHGTGCYTSQCAMKLWNRKNELMGKTAEGNAAMANWLGALPYPSQDLYNNWIKVIWNQNHDGITGTSLPEAYTNSLNDEVIAQNGFSTILKNAVGATVRSLDTRTTGNSIVVYNPLSIAREDIVEASIAASTKPTFVRVYDKAGTEIPAQITSFKGGQVTFIFAATVQSLGYEVYDARPSSTGVTFSDNLSISTTSVESSVYKITINAAGDVSSIIDKRYNNKELLSSPLRLALMPDNSNFWPSWEIVQESVTAAPIGYVDGSATITIDEDGPVRVALKIVREKNNSLYVQKIRLTEKGPKERIDFVTGVDWGTLKTLLKATFPLTVSNSKATYDLGLGTIQRPTNNNTLWEVYAQQWADLTSNDNSYGVSILNDCKYGWDKPSDNTMRLTLIHTPNVTDRYVYQGIQDLGSHQFTYSLYGHSNQLSNANTHWEAAKLNEPLLSFEAPKHDGFLGKSFSFAGTSSNQIDIKALKKAADSDEIVFRVYELNGKDANNVSVTFNSNILAASELNGIEERIGAASYSGKSMTVNLTAYQPKTFSVSLAAPSQTLSAPVSKPLTLVYD
ncbi:MAG: RICIN domain-containing protein, partial [Cytophagales bacterium]|nr:RICIN domain-containing protein [Cytophaga sp.]